MKIRNIITATIGALILPLTINSCATTTSPSAQSGVKSYNLDTCIVTNNKLGSMGDPVTKIYNGQEVKFCCTPCIKKFEKNPAKYLAKLR